MPLHRPYRSWLASDVADINHIAEKGGAGAGAITAALFLEEFLAKGSAGRGAGGAAEEGGEEEGEEDVAAVAPPWVHVDFQGWNEATSGARVKGGEAMGMRALFGLVESVADGTVWSDGVER
jgi:leucyl aminopeptidase